MSRKNGIDTWLDLPFNVFIIDHDEMFYNIKICLNVTKKGIIHRILSMTKFLSSKLPKNHPTIFVAIS